MDMQFCAQPNFNSVFSFTHGQQGPMQYPEEQYPVFNGFPGLQYIYPTQQGEPPYPDRNSLGPDGKSESKPRLSKEEVDKLEKVFQENPKPSSSVKAQLADGLGLERPRINNWFQNRRAKAKQEKKLEEYEARRAAEKASEPSSPNDTPSSAVSDVVDDQAHQPMKPSSSVFTDMSAASQSDDALLERDEIDDDASGDSEAFGSPFAQHPNESRKDHHEEFHSPPSMDFPTPEQVGFTYAQTTQGLGLQGIPQGFPSFVPFPSNGPAGQSCPEAAEEQAHKADYQADQYLKVMGMGYPSSSITPSFSAPGSISEHDMESIHTEENETIGSPTNSIKEQTTPGLMQGVPTPGDSFKSPPPPANIASRRNIPRPAALQAASLRNRPYNLGCGPKTALDSPRRVDPSSPATAMRRIASTGGNMAGRIQKQSTGPRSPMFFGRNAEALLQYSRSPVSAISTAFSGAAPPTPMTPMVLNPQAVREPTVSSSCSDDEAFIVGSGVPTHLVQEFKAESLKTPPTTPGMMGAYGAQCFTGNPFGASIDFAADQPLLTPYFQTEFPDLSFRNNMPSYVDLSDNSLPSTPLYPNMTNSVQEPSAFPSGAALGSTQFDWDANESVTSSKSSLDQPRARQIQFTPNVTPQDYNPVQER